jgi:hypothetical protein
MQPKNARIAPRPPTLTCLSLNKPSISHCHLFVKSTFRSCIILTFLSQLHFSIIQYPTNRKLQGGFHEESWLGPPCNFLWESIANLSPVVGRVPCDSFMPCNRCTGQIGSHRRVDSRMEWPRHRM